MPTPRSRSPLSTYAVVSPADWSLAAPTGSGLRVIRERLGLDYDELATRCHNAVYEFVSRTFDEEAGAAHHYYRADTRRLSEMDSGNFLIAVNFLVMYDLTGDLDMLRRAAGCYRWAYLNRTARHPMFTWQGGVRDELKPHELYVKYTCDALTTAALLYQRTEDDDYLFHTMQYHSFLKQARRADFAYKYDDTTYTWWSHGFSWNGFGGPVTSYLQLWETTGDERFRREAEVWGRHGLAQQAEDGGFYLLDGEFWNSDLTALELRSLVFLFELTRDEGYLSAATRFADWLLGHQRGDGAWPIGIDRDGEVSAPNVGPGDMPNIALSLLRLHMNRPDLRYLDAAVRAVRYGIGSQAVEGGANPRYLGDPRVRWGFWSWDPAYDLTLSGDQSVHHIRGMLVLAHYLGRDAS